MKKNLKDWNDKDYLKATVIICAVALFTIIAIAGAKLAQQQARREAMELVTYQQYREYLEAGAIDTVSYNPTEEYMYFSLHNDETRKMTVKEREEYITPIEDCKKVIYPAGEDFRKELLEYGVLVYKSDESFSDTLSNYSSLIFQIILIGIMLKMFTNMSPMKGNSINEAKPEEISESFADVIGHDEVKEDLKLLIKQMKSKDADFKNLTHGILFEGREGTGKTMLAKAVAKEAGFSFISVNSSSLIQLYVGLGAKRVREVFERARKQAPCILFFDEIDAIKPWQ